MQPPDSSPPIETPPSQPVETVTQDVAPKASSIKLRHRFKIIHHSHSGRLRPHEHTSYIALFAMLFVVGAALTGLSIASYVSAAPPDPIGSSIGLTGAMPGVPPTLAATIDIPIDQQHFMDIPVRVSGTCPVNTLVEIYKNDIFAGSSPCEATGTYSLDIDLLYGENKLTAQVYDALNQAGPLSDPVTVFYDATPNFADPLSILNLGGAQLLLNTDSVYRGTFPGQELNVPLNILGGTAPFAINVQWGDSNNKVIPRADNSIFNAPHVYDKPGTYKITFQATDSHQQTAFLTVAAIINGQPGVLAGTSDSQGSSTLLNKLLVLWPVYAVAFTLVTSFWIGERHEKRILIRSGLTQQNPALSGSTHISL